MRQTADVCLYVSVYPDSTVRVDLAHAGEIVDTQYLGVWAGGNGEPVTFHVGGFSITLPMVRGRVTKIDLTGRGAA